MNGVADRGHSHEGLWGVKEKKMGVQMRLIQEEDAPGDAKGGFPTVR